MSHYDLDQSLRDDVLLIRKRSEANYVRDGLRDEGSVNDIGGLLYHVFREWRDEDDLIRSTHRLNGHHHAIIQSV